MPYANNEYRRQYMKEWRAKHLEEKKMKDHEYYQKKKEEIKEKRHQYYIKNKTSINQKLRLNGREQRGFKYVSLSDEDRVDLRELALEGEYVKQQMSLYSIEESNEFSEFCKTNDMTVDENIEKALAIARRICCRSNAGLGRYFELVIQKLMLNIFDETPFKVYRQVPFGQVDDNCKYCRKIDFVVSEEDVPKNQLNLSKAVVVSCKTSLNTRWREDEAIFDKCKYYIMVTLDDKIPQCQLPDNVRFCTPSSDMSEHTNDMNALTQTIQAMLSDEF